MSNKLFLHQNSGVKMISILFLLYGLTKFSCFALPTTIHDLEALKSNHSIKMRNAHEPFLLNAFNKSLNSEGVFIRGGGWGAAILGNRFSTYFEALTCSDIVGAHFIDRSTGGTNDQETTFFKALPKIRLHPNPAHLSQYALSHKWNRTCPLASPFPHENVGAWNHRPELVSEILHNAANAVFKDVFSETVPANSFVTIKSDQPVGDTLPLVPSAAVMFRCVDILWFEKNAVGYGFLNFNAYTELIPNDVTHIYVLGEELNYLDLGKKDAAIICADLADFLVTFLHKKFPAAVVALRRGHVIESLTMISNTQTLVSAPSTFSLWGGIANTNRVYLMSSGKNPLLRDAPYIRDNFMWLTYPELILGGDHVHYQSLPPKETVAVLSGALTEPLARPVHFVTHVVKEHK